MAQLPSKPELPMCKTGTTHLTEWLGRSCEVTYVEHIWLRHVVISPRVLPLINVHLPGFSSSLHVVCSPAGGHAQRYANASDESTEYYLDEDEARTVCGGQCATQNAMLQMGIRLFRYLWTSSEMTQFTVTWFKLSFRMDVQ